MRSISRLSIALLLTLALVLACPSRSFSAPSGTASIAANNGQPAMEAASLSSNKLDQFARAYLQILQLLGDRQAELPEDETIPAALDIQQSIEADTVRIIEDSGLTLPEYMQILERANQDESFQREIFDQSLRAETD